MSRKHASRASDVVVASDLQSKGLTLMPILTPSLPFWNRRTIVPIVTTLGVVFAVTVAMVASGNRSADAAFDDAAVAKPAKKDSSARTKPKQVELTATVEPLQAQPGEVVTYSITAKLQPGWHIYKFAKVQEGEGPRNTKFDFFDRQGLVAEGEWTASKEVIRRKEPSFPDLDAIEFYEDEVTWSIKLKVPDDAKAGTKTLRCQASYQICDEKSCSFPGQWTINDVELKVGPAFPVTETAAKRDPSVASTANPAEPTGPKPLKADSQRQFQPTTAILTASIAPTEAKPGDKVVLTVKAKLNPGFHIYQYNKTTPPKGPSPTQFDLFDNAGLKVVGDWKGSFDPIVKEEPVFDGLLVEYFEDEAVWNLPLQVPDDAAPGSKTLKLQASYQVCDEKSCSQPGQWTLNDIALAIVPGSGDAAKVAATSPPAGEPKPPVESKPTTPPTTSATVAALTPTLEAPTKTAPAEPAKVVSTVEATARQGIIPLMIASAIGGLFALMMPCVWPMIPITVNFFVKQGQAKNGTGKTTGLAVTYCLAIIGIFTMVGVLCSFFFNANALARLANNPWLNFGVAAMFLAFGLSLLGLFEIRLPSFFLNASAQNEGRGGLIGIVFMALTLTITSFTCTFPVVGGLLVMAAGGEFFYPIIGLATFSAVLAFPFFLLALAPGLLKALPKGGDWMNTVKVVGGLIEIGAAFKFINTAELAWVASDQAWCDAQFVLSVWVVLAAVCGFYLLGFFRTDHDYEEPKVGPGRIVLGSFFLVAALFLAPALFGRPPQSQIWNELVVGLLPPDATELTAQPLMAIANGTHSEADVKATETDPEKAERQERKFHGVSWGLSFDQALEEAKRKKKPVLIDYTGVNCANCRKMEQTVFVLPEVAKALSRFVTVELYTDFVDIASLTADERRALAEKNQERQLKMTNEATNPFYVIVTPDSQVVEAIGGYNRPDVFMDFLTKGFAKATGAEKIAQSETAR